MSAIGDIAKSAGVTRGAIFSIKFEVDEQRMRQLKESPERSAKAITKGAERWHAKILPRHFQPDAASKYGYALRSKSYRLQKSKKGLPPLVWDGYFKRDLKSFASYTPKSANSVQLLMKARVLNLIPRIAQNSQDLYVAHASHQKKSARNRFKTSTYPNILREVKVILEDEREELAVEIAAEMNLLFGPTALSGKAMAAAMAWRDSDLTESAD